MRALGTRWGKARSSETSATCEPRSIQDQQDEETIGFVRPYTMTSLERIRALCSAVRYIEQAQIEGAVVECGVWRGGSMMAVARTLTNLGATRRHLYLFDTFEGMTKPGPRDIALTGETATCLLEQSERTEDDRVWCYAPIERVAKALSLTGYPNGLLHLIPGRVEETLATAAPERIALLRLDTDWYESTRQEMNVLFPRLARGGVLIIDDYGHWQGAREAVDEYVKTHQLKLLLHPIDYTGRIAVKAFD
ncbi:MAG TPA: TylF/MycF/NovP-related O-methyltransferase [Nitrospira sp.]|nr:TylF/MycF/NovP-related O-methyltransferase [Nitrospira sp.]